MGACLMPVKTSAGRVRLAAALLALAAACSGSGGRLTTPTSTPAPGADPAVQVDRQAFPAKGGSGVVASARYPGVLWAIRDRGGSDQPGRPKTALYAYKTEQGQVSALAPQMPFRAIPVVGASNRDWEDIARDDQGGLWIADIGNNECDRDDTAVLRLREPDPVRDTSAPVAAFYRYRFPDPPTGCVGRNAEAMFLVDGIPYLIAKTARSTVYRFPRLDPSAVVTLEKVGTLAGPGGRPPANLSGADLSSDRRLLAVDSHTRVFVFQARDPAARGQALVAHLIARPPRWTISLGPDANVEGIAFSYRSHDLQLLAENGNLYFVAADAYAR
jgi:hypothetical protein